MADIPVENYFTITENTTTIPTLSLLTQDNLPTLLAMDNQRGQIEFLLSSHLDDMAKLNDVIVDAIKDSSQKEAQRQKLITTYNLLVMSFYINFYESRFHRLADLKDALEECSKYLKILDDSADTEALAVKINNDFTDSRWKIPACMPQCIHDFAHAQTKQTIAVMDESNNVRLYWVWASGMLLSLMDLISDTFHNIDNTRRAINMPSRYTGLMSWVLYYFRFGYQASLFIKHTIDPTIKLPPSLCNVTPDSWHEFELWTMHEQERTLGMNRRAELQWGDRQYRIINDGIWGPANMACFLWLVGSGFAGYAGNVLTGALLFMDFALSVKAYYEQEEARKMKMADRDKVINDAREALEKAKETQDANLIAYWQHVLFYREQMKARTAIQHHHQKLRDLGAIAYTGGLFVAFWVASALFLPPFAFTVAHFLMITFLGSTFCFSANALYSFISGVIDIWQSMAMRVQTKNECKALFAQFDSPAMSDADRKVLYLQMRSLLAEADYHNDMIVFHKIKLARTVLIDLSIPLVLFCTITFMTPGVAVACIAAFMIVSLISYLMIKQFEPKLEKADLPQNDEGFAALKKECTFKKLKQIHKNSFFSPKTPAADAVPLLPSANYQQDIISAIP